MITDFEKYLYNTHLKITRKNKPYKLRKDFSDLAEKDIVCLKKLAHFFNSHREIKPEIFFSAPYDLYKDETHFDLSFFTTLKAIKAFTLQNKNIETLDPDAHEQLNFVKSSIMFINKFCRKNNFNAANYINHKTNNMHSFLLHLRDRSVNIYTLFGFKDFDKSIKNSDLDVLKFMFGENFLNNIALQRIKFFNSVKCKHLVSAGLQKLFEFNKKPVD